MMELSWKDRKELIASGVTHVAVLSRHGGNRLLRGKVNDESTPVLGWWIEGERADAIKWANEEAQLPSCRAGRPIPAGGAS